MKVSAFLDYVEADDCVGADMARKYLQMGYTRARRSANYKGGKKYNRENNYALNERGTGDPDKAKSATIFYEKWSEAESNQRYAHMKKRWKTEYG